jgi:methylenetetrahydrofolate reductase (NADPH)
MWDKRKYSTHVISNMTFDAEQIGTWAERLRRRGITLPLIVGVLGPSSAPSFGMASKIGVGESLRFLRKAEERLRPHRGTGLPPIASSNGSPH